MPVADEPAVAAGGGWWRPANPGKRLWDAAAPVAAHDRGQPVEIIDRDPLAGRVRVAGKPERLQLSMSFLPVTPVATAERWRIDAELAVPSAALGGTRGPSRLTGTVCTLESPEIVGETGHGAFLAVLATTGGAYYAVGAAAIPDGDVLRVTVDPGSCRHIDDRARP